MEFVNEPAQDIPVAYECDVCVIGGSCTGVFAAVSAARLGSSVCVIEQNGYFGGVATAGLVNIWHSIHDIRRKEQVIGGLTVEVIERLKKRDAVTEHAIDATAFILNTEELKIELDELIMEAGVRPFLHARFCAPVSEDGQVKAVIIEDKSGRRAIKAKMFIDASGDGDLLERADLSTRKLEDLQPPTACALFEGVAKVYEGHPEFQIAKDVFNSEYPEALKKGFLWASHAVGSEDLTMVAGTRVNNADCSDADQLTDAEIEGRRQVRVMMDILKKYKKNGDKLFLRALPSYIGIRETRHADCLHTLTETELLAGEDFPDTIASGTYRIDIHHSDKPGLTFRYLDGREIYVNPDGEGENGRWREDTGDDPHCYHIPYQSLVPKESKNILAAGRLIDADRGAYGAIRVMVLCNQTGEASGAACHLALESGNSVAEVDTDKLRNIMKKQGSIL